MRKLSEILRQSNINSTIESLWGSTEAASDYGKIPAGEYTADIVAGEAIEGRANGTPGYRLTFVVVDGDFSGRRFWHDLWFTEKALPQAKRDLAKIGVTELKQLDRHLPAVFRCTVKLGLRRDGEYEANHVRRFEVLEATLPKPDAFAPKSHTAPKTLTRQSTETRNTPTNGPDPVAGVPTIPRKGRILIKKRRKHPTDNRSEGKGGS
jgi:hypothetical protein